ncbi:hypothetical protein [Saccharothrix longispora]|uniref:hypothetical protein n=1 Tax=Saccharothrix longispora TaxID=33920 RepID=UPI0028FD52EB|nr:hypothetical protein [Saccharothrix longispora]MDU0288365.1 hypothetical protein [Saccharothrix longispora]
MVGTRLLLGAFWLATLFLAVAFRDEAPGALPAVLAGGVVLLLGGVVMRAVDKRRHRPPDR